MGGSPVDVKWKAVSSIKERASTSIPRNAAGSGSPAETPVRIALRRARGCSEGALLNAEPSDLPRQFRTVKAEERCAVRGGGNYPIQRKRTGFP